MAQATSPGSLFIVDNSDTDWKVRSYLVEWCDLSQAIDIATGYFEIGALLALEDKWQKVDKIRLLIGDEVSMRTKRAFAEGLRKTNWQLDSSVEAVRGFRTWFGFRRTGSLLDETARSLINGLLRDGELEKDGRDWIRRI